MAFNNPAIIVDTNLVHAADAPDWSTPGDLLLDSPAGTIVHAIHWCLGQCEFIGKAELFTLTLQDTGGTSNAEPTNTWF
jgi:hypothetical protein